MDTLYIVVPCYNEEEVLPETSKRLLEKMQGMISAGTVSPDSRVMFVDDGSRDKTWEIISGLCAENAVFAGVKLSRNRGHQNAVLAGLMTAKNFCDMAISLDADLQDDVNAIDEFVRQFQQGCDIVYGVRSSRETDTAFKRGTAHGFYRLMKWLGVDIVEDHADYRLMSRRALEALERYEESNLFLRGIVPQIGYKTGIVKYSRNERFAGQSKYPLKKMLAFAIDGVTSFSVKPLGMIAGLGAAVSFISGLWLLTLLVLYLSGVDFGPELWVIASVFLAAGLQILCTGVAGEYIGKIYSEVKHRPRYIIEDVLKR